MTSDQLRNVILEAVDCLRQRKCRPDRESIAVFVMPKLGSSMNEIFSEIENIVDQGSLLKVEYKGSTSYRSPKNFDLKNSPLLTKHSKILNSSKTTRYVISGINELLSTFPNYTQEGIPYDELKKKLLGFDEGRFAEAGIKIIFEREEAAGNILVAESTDTLYPIRIFPKDLQVPTDMKLISFMEDANLPPEGKKRKRAKKSEGGEGQGVVTVPNKSNAKNKKKPEVVYAVKSDPSKLLTVNPAAGDELMKAKAEQLSSISLKVVSGKARTPKGKGNKSELTNKTELDMTFDRKPSLALIKHDESVAEKSDQETPVCELNGLTEEAGKADIKVSKPKKRKSEPASSRAKPSSQAPKVKKQKLNPVANSENDSDDLLSVSQVPPRYTYSAKRRVRSSYDDDDNHLDRSELFQLPDESTDSANGHTGICAYCRREENSAGNPEDFLSCGTCNAKIHPTCIDYTEDHATRLRMNSKSNDSHLQWQCFSCKRCGVCQNALMSSKNPLGNEKDTKEKSLRKKEQRYVLCDRCDRGYHVNCIKRTPPAPLNGNSWYCTDCDEVCSKGENGSVPKVLPKKLGTGKQAARKTAVKKKGRKQNQQSGSGQSAAVSNKNGGHLPDKASVSESSSSLESDNEIPDFSTWTPSQVQKYFTEKGLREEAASLKEQEIDGMSLLLLRRADVIFGLNLRLGPALKIYRLVCQLQQHSSALKKKSNSETASVSNRPND